MIARTIIELVSRATLIMLCCLIVGVRPTVASANLGDRLNFDIPAQELPAALLKFARQTGVQVTSEAELIEGKNSAGVVGTWQARQALEQILKGTHLRFDVVDENTVLIRSVAAPSQPAPGHTANARILQSPLTTRAEDQFRFAQADQKAPAVTLEEVVVTAQKKSERLMDVPIPIAVISADTLAETNRTLLVDYYSSIPGLSVQPGPFGGQALTIRGVGFANGAPTTGRTIDDIPFGASSDFSGGATEVEIDPGDLDHIEVLRGPQGTLYGANSEGGLIKYVTKDPSTTEYSGRIEAGASGVYNGTKPGYTMRTSANIPVDDTLAVRLSGFTRQSPGYVDNPVLNLTGVNEAQTYGGRTSLLWKPVESVSLKVSALYQRLTMGGSSEVMVGQGLSGLQNNLLPGLQGDGIKQTVQAYGAVLKADLGLVQLTSLSGYNEINTTSGFDYSAFLGGVGAPADKLFGVTGSGFIAYSPVKTCTQELRLSGSARHRFDWVAGGFYKNDRLHDTNVTTAANSSTGLIAGYLGYFEGYIRSSKEYAGFADATFHVTDRLDIQLGARESHDQIVVPQSISTGPLYPSGPTLYAGGEASANTFTYLVTPQFKLAPDMMLYARTASGYRPGGPNSNSPTAVTAGAPPLYGPDKTENYELGFKGDFLDHRLSIDASVYHIKWSDVQLYALINKNLDITNGGTAKSEGVEFSVQARPVRGLTLSGWVSYDNAELTQNLPPGSVDYGLRGDRLPYVPRTSAHLAAEDEFPILADVRAFVAAEFDYQGERLGLFTGDKSRQYYSSYTKANLRFGTRHETWQVSLYANNITNSRGVVNGGIGTFTASPNAPSFWYITPRTLGASIVKTF